VNIDFGFGMYKAFEGENFILPGLKSPSNACTPPFNSSLASFETWLCDFLPGFSETDITIVEKTYPADGTAEVTGSYNTTHLRAQLIYRDLVLACPAFWLSRAATKAGYVGQYAIAPAQHGSDTGYWNRVNPALQKASDVTYLGYTGAFASFFETGDPNAHKLKNVTVLGAPEVNRMHEEWAVLLGGEFGNALLEKDTLGPRCGFWRGVAARVPI
jgi:hypothetical protein